MDKLNFPFVEKEGKYFASIVSTQDEYLITDLIDDDGNAIDNPTATGSKIVAGVKGVRMRVRMTLPTSVSSSKSELFAVNTEVVHSSN